MKKVALALIILGMMIAGCGKNPTEPIVDEGRNNNLHATCTPTATIVITNESTIPISTPTAIPTSTVTSTPTATIVKFQVIFQYITRKDPPITDGSYCSYLLTVYNAYNVTEIHAGIRVYNNNSHEWVIFEATNYTNANFVQDCKSYSGQSVTYLTIKLYFTYSDGVTRMQHLVEDDDAYEIYGGHKYRIKVNLDTFETSKEVLY